MSIALATSKKYPNLDGGETLLFDAIKTAGINVENVVWDDKSVNWGKYSHVIIRSCWDYHLRVKEFLAWVSNLEKTETIVLNRPDLIRWNSDKSYLLDLRARGITIPDTTIITEHDIAQLDDLLQQFPADTIIVKPCHGAGGYGLKQFNRRDSSIKQYVTELLKNSDVILQSFIPEIINGEISAMFFGNELSHAVIKKPQPGDYRSNYEFGGHEEPFKLDEGIKPKIIELYKQCDVDTLYARLDVVNVNGGLMLMELELIEPYLFFEYGDGSAELFVEKLIKLTS